MLLRLGVAALTVAMLACAGDAKDSLLLDPTSTNVAGTYSMRSADGVSPPYTAFTTSTEQWRLISDTVVIKADHTWEESTNYLVFLIADGSSFARQSLVSGSYSIANDKINFVMTTGGAESFFGSVTGSALNVIYKGKRLVYGR